MKKNIICVLVMLLVMSLIANAFAEWDPKRAFAGSDGFDYNQETGEWSWTVYFTPENDPDYLVWIGLHMEGDAEGWYLPEMIFSIEDVASHTLVDRIEEVYISVGDFDHYSVTSLMTNSYGEQYICLGKAGMKMLEKMQKWGFSYVYCGREGTAEVNPDKSSAAYKNMKKEMKRLLDSNWWRYCDPDVYAAY